MIVVDPIEELHGTRLYGHLAAQSKEFAGRLTTFVAAIAPILATTKRHFPLFTRHDAHHGFRVTTRLDQVLDERCFELTSDRSIGPAEILLLVAAAYAHDLGMTVFPGEDDAQKARLSLSEATWFTDVSLTDYLRAEHSRRGGQYIQAHAKELGVPDNLVSPLDWMMRSHNLSIAELDIGLREPFAAEERIVDVRQLAAILCVGDAIEFSDTRVLDGVLELAKADGTSAGETSYRENRKHDCIRGGLALDDDGQVVVSGTFDEPEVLALAHRTFDQVEGWIRGYCDIDRTSRVPRLRIRPEPFRRRLDLFGARFERLGVRMNKRSVIDLIASNAVWRNDEGIAVRELIQNAVEACRYRQHHSTPADRYSPAVRVTFDRSNRTITVQDNGCGMSESTVLNNFLTVGSSRSREPAYADEDYAPIARFGIGFWSTFTIAERAYVETAAFERSNSASSASAGFGFDIALDELKDYTVFQPKSVTTGCSLTLYLKPDVVMDNVFERTRGHLLAAAVDLTLVLDGEETRIPSALPEITSAGLLGARQRAMEAQGVRTFAWRGELDATELTSGMVYRVDTGGPTFRANENQSLLSSLGGMHQLQGAICGFTTVVPRRRTCFALERVGGAAANHRTPRGFEFSLDRQTLIENDSQRAFASNVTQLLHTAYRAFLAEIGANSPQAIFRLNEESELNGGNVFDQYTGGELADARAHWADLLCFRLFPVENNGSQAAATPIYVDLNGLLAMSGECWVVQNRLDISMENGLSRSIDPGSLLAVAYESVKRLHSSPSPQPTYLLDANRPASMLFDADPTSSIEFVQMRLGGIPAPVTLCAQRVSLAKLQFDDALHGILVQVRGRWTGAVYVREFKRPDGKPYAFLGRHRLLIDRASPLHDRIGSLKNEGRPSKIASLVADLQEDDAGFRPGSLEGLL